MPPRISRIRYRKFLLNGYPEHGEITYGEHAVLRGSGHTDQNNISVNGERVWSRVNTLGLTGGVGVVHFMTGVRAYLEHRSETVAFVAALRFVVP